MKTRELFFNVGGDPGDDTPYIQAGPRREGEAEPPPIPLEFLHDVHPPNRAIARIPNEDTGGADVRYDRGRKVFRIILPPLDKETQAEAGEVPQLPPEYHGDSDKVALHYGLPQPVYPPAGRLQASGRWLTSDGARLKWRGIMAFRLVEYLAHGNRGAYNAALDFYAEHRVFPRMLVMMDNPSIFPLPRDEGLAALPQVAADLKARGLYGAVVALTGTKAVQFDWDDQVRRVGQIADSAGNLRVAIGNEMFPIHGSESGDLSPERLQQLARLLPSSVPVSLGSSHGPECESKVLPEAARTLQNGLALAHDLRVGDENGWKWVRHPNDLGWIADDTRIYLVSEEPQRSDMTPGKHLATAIVCHGIRNIGDVFHYSTGVQAVPPVGAELAAFLARKQGWDISNDWHGTYANAGQVGSPVKGFSNGLRCYSSYVGGEALVVACDAANMQIEWHDGVRTTLIAERDGAKVWRASR